MHTSWSPGSAHLLRCSHDCAPAAQLNPKKKEMDKLKEDLATDALGVAGWKGMLLMTSNGPLTSRLTNATIG